MDELDAALGGLRAAGWPAPEDPGGDDDAGLEGRDLIWDRLLDEAGWLHRYAGWLTHLHTKGFPSAVNLRPEGGHPERAHVVADLPRVAAILNRIAADVDELARARRVAAWMPRRCWVTGAPNDGAAQQNRTWTSGSSAAAASCPSPSAPGARSPLNVTGAAKPAPPPIRRTTRYVTASWASCGGRRRFSAQRKRLASTCRSLARMCDMAAGSASSGFGSHRQVRVADPVQGASLGPTQDHRHRLRPRHRGYAVVGDVAGDDAVGRLDAYTPGIPLGRVSVPADLDGAALFLAGPGSDYITGQVIIVQRKESS